VVCNVCLFKESIWVSSISFMGLHTETRYFQVNACQQWTFSKTENDTSVMIILGDGVMLQTYQLQQCSKCYSIFAKISIVSLAWIKISSINTHTLVLCGDDMRIMKGEHKKS
jgi:hypothetical protein